MQIQADASLLVDGRPLALDQLLPYLAPKLGRNPDKPVIIHPLPEAPYGSMVAVYDELRQGKDRAGAGQRHPSRLADRAGDGTVLGIVLAGQSDAHW